MEPLRSERGILLAWSTIDDFTQNVVTVELSLKWYGIQIVYAAKNRSAGSRDVPVVEWPFPGWAELTREYAYVDHVPNPRCIEAFARHNGYQIDELAREL